ncbi:MAG: ATP-binding protein [Nitrospirae bacterium]|nr:ATP-binding protein [Nitrospirota bacterium]
MKETLLEIPSHPKYLSVVRSVIKKLCEIFNVEDSITEDLKLAVDEACTNIIRHAYRDDFTRKISIRLRVSRRRFQAIIEDDGEQTPEQALRGRDLDDVRPGGLGMHFIKKTFDEVRYERHKDINRLTLSREL